MNPRHRRWIATGSAAGCLVVLGAVASLVGEPWETSATAPSHDVEVPPSPEGEAPDADRDRATAWEPPAPTVLCQPAPCERWRIHLPSGMSVVDGDTVYHVGSTNWRTEVTAVDIASGAVRWRETLAVPDAVNGARLDVPSPPPFTGHDDIIVVGIEGRLEARSRSDGEVTWTFDRDGLLPYSLAAGPSDTVIVLAGERGAQPSSEPGWSSELVLSVDAVTGQLRWEREVIWPLNHGPFPEGVVLVTAESPDEPQGSLVHGSLQALDALTGETLWQRTAPREGYGVSRSTVRVYVGGRSEFWDIRTGEPLDLPIPDELGEHVDVEVVGNLVAVRSYPDEGPDTLTPASIQQLTVFDRTEGIERFTASAPRWVEMLALPDGGALVVSGDDRRLELTVLEPAGDPRWALELGASAMAGWPRWPEVFDDGTFTIIASGAPDLSDLAAHRFDASTGEPLESFHLDVDLDEVEPHDLQVRWPVVVGHHSDGSGMRLHGPAGSLNITQYVEVLSVDPLVVRTPSGALARLDEGILLR